MELHQLRYLTSVVDDGSFTAAAARLHVSQSGVSAQVAKFERELGQRLLERGPRPLRLTTAGEFVLPLVREALDAVDRIAQAADELTGLIRGRVVLGMVRGCSTPTFLDAIATFRTGHPQVELSLAEDDSVELQRRVVAGDLDLALVAWSGALEPGLDAHVVVDEPVVLVIPDAHRLARRRTPTTWHDLDGETILCLPRGTGIRAAVDASVESDAVKVRIDLEASSPETVLGLVRRGVGLALLTTSMAAAADGVAIRPLPGSSEVDAARARLGIVRRAGHGPNAAGRVLHDALVATMGGQPAEAGSGAQHRP